MQEHFNENYMEAKQVSQKPSSKKKKKKKGKIVNIDKVNFQQNGTYPVTVKGQLDMHGVKKTLKQPALLESEWRCYCLQCRLYCITG